MANVQDKATKAVQATLRFPYYSWFFIFLLERKKQADEPHKEAIAAGEGKWTHKLCPAIMMAHKTIIIPNIY